MIVAGPSNSRKIPTLLGLVGVLALTIVVAITTQGVGQITKLFSQAEAPAAPTSVGVANITDTSATIYWSTDKDTAGSVFYGKTAGLGDGVAVDDRDATHLVRLSNLKPSTKYYFKIGVGSQSFGDPAKNGNPYELTTGATLPAPPVIDPIFGQVLDLSGAPAAGTLVVWETSGATKIASLAKSDGNYVLPINNARVLDLGSYPSLTEGLAEAITFTAGAGSPLATLTCKIGQDRPLPTVKLGETIDCSQKTTPPTSSFQAPPASSVASPSAGTLEVNVTEGQVFSSPLPTISGKAGPNQVVQIVVRSELPYSGTVQADPSGSWSWTPPANLTPGQHTVTITVVNPDGTTQTVTRTFTVASGTTILPVTSGTPSAQLTHLSCVGSTCSTVAGAGPNTCSQDTDCVATPAATIPPPTPPPSPPPTGNTENTLMLLTLGLIFGTLGGVIILRQNGPR